MITVPVSPAAVEFDHVSFSYGQTTVLKDFSLAVPPGDHVALLGPNGSGKSTILDLIVGTALPQTGRVLRAAPTTAFVPQRSTVSDTLPITVRDTVRMGRWADRGMWRRLTTEDHAIVRTQLERLGLTELASRRVGQLSGGQRQRVLIAQALAQHAPTLLLDEPEAGLDREAQRIIAGVIREEVARGTTVIVATHDTATASAAKRCVLLRGYAGGVIADGPPEAVVTDTTLARAFAPRHEH